jgi:proteasome accessory factor B
MFERDKEMLRSMGIPLSTVDIDDSTLGYALPSAEYEMPDPGLTEEERAAIWLASRIARMGGFGVADDAFYKLGGATDRQVAKMGADLGTGKEALGFLFAAITDRVPVGFRHREKPRRVDPYGVLHQRGHWYLVGGTTEGVRSFRVDRGSDWKRVGEAGSFTRPSHLDLRSAVPLHPWESGSDGVVATVRFDDDITWWVRRQVPDATWRAVDGGVEVDLVTRNTAALISWVLEFGAQAELIGPPDLRAALVGRLSGE